MQTEFRRELIIKLVRGKIRETMPDHPVMLVTFARGRVVERPRRVLCRAHLQDVHEVVVMIRVKLIAAHVNGKTRMIPDPLDRVATFLLHEFEKRRVVRIIRAPEGKLVPEEDARLVAEVIKPPLFPDAPAPHAKHIHVGILSEFNQALIGLLRYSPEITVGRYPICSSYEG